jgi:hypothetical protein
MAQLATSDVFVVGSVPVPLSEAGSGPLAANRADRLWTRHGFMSRP